MAGSSREVDLADDCFLGGDLFRVTFRAGADIEAIATLTLAAHAKDRLAWNCDHCRTACEHVGALFSVLLEHKSQLGLAAPPPEKIPAAELSEEQLITRAWKSAASAPKPSG